MYLQEILEVAIGLIFVWLALSFTTMTLQEWISNLVNLRARDLEKAIVQMLNSPNLAQSLFKYPLIANLCTPAKKPGQKPRLPSYIPAQKFSAALFELVIQAGTNNSPVHRVTKEIEKQLASIKSPEQQQLAREDWDAIAKTARNIAASGLGKSALDGLKFQINSYAENHPDLVPTLTSLVTDVDIYYKQFVEEQRAGTNSGTDFGLAMRQFRLGMLALQKINPRLSDSVTAILRQAEVLALNGTQAVASTRINLETWFNDAMERLSEAYKRRATTISFIIGFILALTLNIDSINVASRLWREPILRQAILVQAQALTAPPSTQGVVAANPLVNITALETQLKGLNIPLGWSIIPFNVKPSQCSMLPAGPGQFWGIRSLDNLGKPICYVIINLPGDLNGWISKMLGMLIAGLAAAQGAPFWFDILKKFISVRATATSPVSEKPVG